MTLLLAAVAAVSLSGAGPLTTTVVALPDSGCQACITGGCVPTAGAGYVSCQYIGNGYCIVKTQCGEKPHNGNIAADGSLLPRQTPPLEERIEAQFVDGNFAAGRMRDCRGRVVARSFTQETQRRNLAQLQRLTV